MNENKSAKPFVRHRIYPVFIIVIFLTGFLIGQYEKHIMSKPDKSRIYTGEISYNQTCLDHLRAEYLNADIAKHRRTDILDNLGVTGVVVTFGEEDKTLSKDNVSSGVFSPFFRAINDFSSADVIFSKLEGGEIIMTRPLAKPAEEHECVNIRII